MKLLTRNEFKIRVFSRDKYKCILCNKLGVDAHHLLDRKLFDDGGYYIDNGVALCYDHHWDAERGDFTPQQLRDKAKIKTIVLPPLFNPKESYDKWGRLI